MTEDPPKRKHPRLKEYDYSQPGCYFVTLCTKNRKQLFGQVPAGRGDLTPPLIQLSNIGRIVENFIEMISTSYNNVSIDKFVIMPNHIHIMLTISSCSASSSDCIASTSSLPTIIRSFKTLVTRSIGHSIWQESFYEHIIRGVEDYQKVWNYIDSNPDNWQEDELYG